MNVWEFLCQKIFERSCGNAHVEFIIVAMIV